MSFLGNTTLPTRSSVRCLAPASERTGLTGCGAAAEDQHRWPHRVTAGKHVEWRPSGNAVRCSENFAFFDATTEMHRPRIGQVPVAFQMQVSRPPLVATLILLATSASFAAEVTVAPLLQLLRAGLATFSAQRTFGTTRIHCVADMPVAAREPICSRPLRSIPPSAPKPLKGLGETLALGLVPRVLNRANLARVWPRPARAANLRALIA